MHSESLLHERLAAIAGPRTFRAIAEVTATNPETVRRYMQGQMPSVEFLAALCSAFKINGEWLLCGRGPMKADDVKSHALKSASGGELLGAMATAIERLADRVERLEVYTQTLESRLRGREHLAAAAHAASPERTAAPAASISTERLDEQRSSPAAETAGAARPAVRARRIADAVAKRPREDAD